MDERDNPINGEPDRFEAVRWPLERIGWAAQRWLIWPLQDRFSQLGGPGRALALGTIAVIAVCGVAVGIGVAGSGSSETAPSPRLAAQPEPLVAATPATTVKRAEPPTLEGAAPVLKPAQEKPKRESEQSAGAAEPRADSGGEPGAAGSSAATDTISSSPAASSSAEGEDGAGQPDGRPAGAKALSVAERFADAFVVYETGGTSAKVRKAFAASATSELSQSLLRRPPRLPANADVPKAKVLNVVPAPSHDGIYPVSVSLLRIGVTSELRLEMEHRKGKRWRVTNVLG